MTTAAPPDLPPNAAGPLARAADAYRAAVPPGFERYEFPLDALDRLGVPVFYAAAFTPDDVALTGVGYGDTELLARASALGEMVETVSTWAAFRTMPRRRGPRGSRAGAAGRGTTPTCSPSPPSRRARSRAPAARCRRSPRR